MHLRTCSKPRRIIHTSCWKRASSARLAEKQAPWISEQARSPQLDGILLGDIITRTTARHRGLQRGAALFCSALARASSVEVRHPICYPAVRIQRALTAPREAHRLDLVACSSKNETRTCHVVEPAVRLCSCSCSCVMRQRANLKALADALRAWVIYRWACRASMRQGPQNCVATWEMLIGLTKSFPEYQVPHS
jgi:hypothetical protein